MPTLFLKLIAVLIECLYVINLISIEMIIYIKRYSQVLQESAIFGSKLVEIHTLLNYKKDRISFLFAHMTRCDHP